MPTPDTVRPRPKPGPGPRRDGPARPTRPARRPAPGPRPSRGVGRRRPEPRAGRPTVAPARRRQPKAAPQNPRSRATGSRRAAERNERPKRERVEVRLPWRWWFLGALFVLLLVVVALLRAPFFAIGAVQVAGESRTSEGAIVAALDLREGQALATYDTEAAEALIAGLPWVETVNVNRGWPSTLRVEIRERVPAAAFAPANGSFWVVVSADAHVLERRLTPPNGVPLVVAPRARIESASIGSVLPDVERLLATSTNLPAQLGPWVDSWVLASDGTVSAELVGSARAVFGAQPDHRTQFVSLASILDGGTTLACISTIDLRIPDTPVVQRDDRCMAVARDLSS